MGPNQAVEVARHLGPYHRVAGHSCKKPYRCTARTQKSDDRTPVRTSGCQRPTTVRTSAMTGLARSSGESHMQHLWIGH